MRDHLPYCDATHEPNLDMISITMNAVTVLEVEALQKETKCIICRGQVQINAEKLWALLHTLCKVHMACYDCRMNENEYVRSTRYKKRVEAPQGAPN